MFIQGYIISSGYLTSNQKRSCSSLFFPFNYVHGYYVYGYKTNSIYEV